MTLSPPALILAVSAVVSFFMAVNEEVVKSVWSNGYCSEQPPALTVTVSIVVSFFILMVLLVMDDVCAVDMSKM